MRSCFSGKWRFFPSRPDLLCEGFHYFVPWDNPTINGPHSFGSAVWQKDGMFYPEYPTGQLWSAGAKWYDGEAPTPLPPDNQIGTTPQFDQDLRYPPLTPIQVVAGFDRQCWVVQHPGVEFDADSFLRPDIVECCWQRVCAKLLELVNDDTPATLAQFQQAFDLLWGATFTLQIHDIPYTRGSFAWIEGKQFQIFFVPGIQDWIELYFELWHGLFPAHDYGPWKASPRWYNDATQLTDFLNSKGFNPDKPITFVCHSKGGAVCWTMAARMLDFKPERDIEILTFGCPKVGDDRLANHPGMRRSRHVYNVGDIVAFLPPDAPIRRFLLLLFTVEQLDALRSWEKFSVYQVMANGAQPELRPLGLLPVDTYIQWAQEFLERRIPIPNAEHFLPVYVSRLAICCDAPTFPFSPVLWALLFGNPDNAYGGLMQAGYGIIQADIISGGLRIGGQGIVVPGAGSGGLELGGEGDINESSGGLELGGEGGWTPYAGSGGLELGGEGDINESSGGLELGGEGELTPVGPGTSCTTATTIPFDTDETFDVAPGEDQWWTFPALSGVTYTVHWTRNTGFSIGVFVYTNTCASPSFEFSIFSGSGSNSFTPGSDTNGYLNIPGDLFGTWNYTVKVTHS